jgi:hypothetical protein
MCGMETLNLYNLKTIYMPVACIYSVVCCISPEYAAIHADDIWERTHNNVRRLQLFCQRKALMIPSIPAYSIKYIQIVWTLYVQ